MEGSLICSLDTVRGQSKMAPCSIF